MKKIWLIITAIVIIVICLSIAIYLSLSESKENIDIKSNNVQITITDFAIENRTTLKENNNIYVGNNLKELENNFYDIKIVNAESGVNIYLNKLWYEFYDEDYIQDEYLAKICREISGKINIGSNTEQFEYVLYKYIKDNYTKVRQGVVAEEIVTNKLSLKFELEDNIVKLIIRGN